MIDDPKIKGVVDTLLALVERCHSRASTLTEKVQELEDEINKLKGESGKALIKSNTDDSYSTEEERKAIESKPSEVGFALSKKKLAALRETRIPETVLDSLAGLKSKRFSGEAAFIDAVTDLIGEEHANAYRELLLKYGCHKKRKRGSKVEKIEIDRVEECAVDTSTLPDDARPCGHEENIVQDIVIKSDNVRFVKEIHHSPLLGRTFTAEVPTGYEGGYGPNIKAEIVAMKYVNNMSEPRILATLRSYGVIVSPAYISARLTSPVHMKPFIDEKDYLFRAALEASPYQQIDDTGCRVNGVNQYVHILCNNLYTAFFTMPRKDRMTILDILRNFEPRRFLFNDDTFHFLEMFNVSDKNIARIKQSTPSGECDEKKLEKFLSELFPNPAKGKNTRTRITEAAAIAHYQQDHENGIVNILIADDAPQFKLLTAFLGLCWIHVGRHFKKLNPIVPQFQEKLKKFQDEFWTY
ncbi:MAG: transposase, partial [Proteobacteria bacterium]|nr:transposase [Pseudomonadota bacterium]